MTQYPNNFPNDTNLAYGIVVGGDINDPAPDNAGTAKVIDPLRHGRGIEATQLPFLTMLRTPTMHEQEQTSMPPEPGSTVAYSWNTGDPSTRVILGQPNEKFNADSTPGNINLSRFHPDVSKSYVTDVKKILSKGFQTTQEDGAEVRKPKDGQNWMHDLTQGLPTHAALYPLAGTVIPAIQQIDTAIEQFSNILSSSNIGNLPGSFASLSSIFSQMSSSEKQQATKNMPPELLRGFESMINLMQSADGGGGFITSGRVDVNTLKTNAIELLQQTGNLHDVVEVLERLQNDEDLHGIDKLQDIEIEVETAFGKIKQKINSKGKNSSEVSEIVQKAIQAFQSMLSSASTNSGPTSSQNMFGEHAKIIAEMTGRVKTDFTKFTNGQMTTAATSDLAKYAQSKVKDILGKLGGAVARG